MRTGVPRSLRSLSRVETAAKGSGLAEAGLSLLLTTSIYGIPLIFAAPFGSTMVASSCIFLVLGATILAMHLGPRVFIFFWITLAIAQNFVVGLWHESFFGAIPLIVTEAKTLSLAFAVLLALPAILSYLSIHRRLRNAVTIYVVTILLQVRSFDSGAVAYLRNFLVPIVLAILIAAITARMTRAERSQFLTSVTGWTIFMLLVGSLGELFAGTAAWRHFLNADDSGALSSLSESTNFLGVALPRVGGTLLEPTNAGYVAAIALLIVLATLGSGGRFRAPNSAQCLLIGAACLVLVLAAAKSGILMLCIAAVSLYLLTRRMPFWTSFGLSWAFSFALTAGYVGVSKGFGALGSAFSNPISIVGGDSTTFHLAGFLYGLQSGIGRVIGHGIGVGGNFNRSQFPTWETWLGTGAESAWGVLAYQSGAFGLAAFLFVLISMGKSWGTASAVIICAWSASAMFAEAMFGPQVAGLAMVAVALLRTDNRLEMPPSYGARSHAIDTHRLSY